MPRAAVICEFNPFHNGHKFLIEKIKSDYADDVICIMSGSFVQRGDIAVTDKYARAETALMHGADMVVELPTVYALSSAATFAESGVRIAADLGCDLLCFGAENSLEELNRAVDLLDSAETQEKTAASMRCGAYYPKALSDAVGEPFADVIRKPNNILAIEYIRACKKFGLTPAAIRREGVNHDDERIVETYASASKIRELIRAREPYAAYTPMTVDDPAFLDAIEPAILFSLKTIDKDELALLPDVSEGLENRIYDTAIQYNSLEEILEQIKTKRYTMARLRRIILCALLGITKAMQETPVPYLRVLGVRKDRTALMRSSGAPLIVDVRRGCNGLDISSKEIFNIDVKASELMNIAKKTDPQNEFSRGVIKY